MRGRGGSIAEPPKKAEDGWLSADRGRIL
jgi:hypothetical protein